MAFNYHQFYSDIRKTLIIQEKNNLRTQLTPIFESEYQKFLTTPELLELVITIPNHLIIKGIINSDNDVFSYIHNKYYPVVEGTIVKLGGNVQDAQDAFQEGIITVTIIAKRNKLSASGNVGNYIVTVAVNKWKEIFKSEKFKNEKPGEVDENGYPTKTDEKGYPLSEEEKFVKSGRYNAMKNGMDAISEKCKKILLERHFREIDYETIAKKFKLKNAKVARSIKQKCMKKLRDTLIEQKYRV